MSEITDELKRYWLQILGYGCIFFGSLYAWVRKPGIAGVLCGCAGVIDLIIVGKNQLVRRGWIKGDDIDTITNWTRRRVKYEWDLVEFWWGQRCEDCGNRFKTREQTSPCHCGSKKVQNCHGEWYC